MCAILANVLAPYSEARHVQFNYTSILTGAIQENTEIVIVDIQDNENTLVRFTDTGQSSSEFDENTDIDQVDVYVILSKYYADTAVKAASRTRVTLTIRDPGDNAEFDAYISSAFVTDNGTYWTVRWQEPALAIALEAGTWDIDVEYEIFAIVE